MKRILFILALLISAASGFAQVPDINYPNPYVVFPARMRFIRDSAQLPDSRSFKYMIQDQFGVKWLYTLPTITATYWNAKLDSVLTSGDSLYQYSQGVRTLRGVIALTGGAPGGAVNSIQYQVNGSTFGGVTNAFTDGTNLYQNIAYGGTPSGGNYFLSSTLNATKGKLYFGLKSNYYDEANNVWHFNKSGLTNTATVGISLEDTTVTTSGVSQNAPILEFNARAFGTTGGTDQSVKFQQFVQSVASGTPSGSYTLRSQINGGSFVNCFVSDVSGNTTLAGTLTVTGNTISNGAAQAVITTPTNGLNFLTGSSAMQLFIRTHNQFAVLNETGNLFTDSVATAQNPTTGMQFQVRSSTRFLGPPSNNRTQINSIATRPAGGLMYDNTGQKLILINNSGALLPLADSAAVAALIAGVSTPTLDAVLNTGGTLTASRTITTSGTNTLKISGQNTLAAVTTTTALVKASDSSIQQMALSSGTWTVSIGNQTNITSSFLTSAFYIRIGNIVHCTVTADVNPTTAALLCQLSFVLPFTAASGTTANMGHGSNSINNGSAFGAGIVSRTSTTAGLFSFYSTTASSGAVSFSFDYTL